VKSVIAGCVFAGVAMTLAPLSAQAQIVTKDRPLDAYESGGPFRSWLDMVSASQAAQPSWMTPLVTVTPRLEQEFRWDFYDQQQGKGSQGTGQHFFNYGGPGGAGIELIPAYNWELFWRLRHTSPLPARKGLDKAGAIGRPSSSSIASSPPTRTMAITS
jgi:hypothetical protein